MEFDDPTKAILKPRQEGESLKVAQTVLRRRDRNIKAKGERARKIAKQKKVRGTVKTYRITPPEKLLKLYRKRHVDNKRLKKIKGLKKSKVKHFGRVLLVQRNRRPGGTRTTKDMLSTMRLHRFNSCVFLPNTIETLNNLKVVAPFVVWGNPCFELVDDLLHKRARIKKGKGGEVLLSDNALIEEHLGECGMFCVEDLVNEIFTCGEKFADVSSRLSPFQLGDFSDRQAHGFVREQQMPWGDLKFKINDRMRLFLGNETVREKI